MATSFSGGGSRSTRREPIGKLYHLRLLPGKSEEIYFNLLKTTCQQHQLQLTPETFFTDFETATHKRASHTPL
jgi:hypothetical protein